MEGQPHQDVATTLGELERKLRELEQELESVGRGGEPDVSAPQAGWSPPRDPPPTGAVPLPDAGPPPLAVPPAAAWQGGQRPPPSSDDLAWGPPRPFTNGAAPEPAGPVPPGTTPLAPSPHPWPPAAPPGANAPPAAAAPPPAATPSASAPRPAAAAAPPPAATPTASAPRPAAAPPPPPGVDLGGRLDELVRFRDQLVTATTELIQELSRVLSALGAGDPDPEAAPLQGDIVVEAGPFADLASLAAFERSVADTPGVASAQVRAFHEGRAGLAVHLPQPVALAAELRARSPLPVATIEVAEGRIVLTLEG